MGCRIIHDQESDKACLFCSTTDIAFGPVFYGDGFDGAADEAEAFIAWVAMAAKEGRLKSKNNLRVPEDPRSYPTPVLMDCYVAFRLEVEAERREGART